MQARIGMNKQLAKTLNKISKQLPKLIKGFEKVYGAQATVTIERIDRPLLLAKGEIQEVSDFISLNPSGLKKDLYISSYMVLYGDNFSAIPGSHVVDFQETGKGTEIIEYLVERGVENLKAIVHLDLYQSFQYDPPGVKIHWFKVQVVTPKENPSIKYLVQDEIYRKDALKMVRAIRKDARL